MNPYIAQAIESLLSFPDVEEDNYDFKVVEALLLVLQAHPNAFGVLISLTISCFFQQEERDMIFLNFVNSLINAWLRMIEDTKLIEESKTHTMH